jgi:hypothetical protein
VAWSQKILVAERSLLKRNRFTLQTGILLMLGRKNYSGAVLNAVLKYPARTNYVANLRSVSQMTAND